MYTFCVPDFKMTTLNLLKLILQRANMWACHPTVTPVEMLF
jgi:hypothetical protein